MGAVVASAKTGRRFGMMVYGGFSLTDRGCGGRSPRFGRRCRRRGGLLVVVMRFALRRPLPGRVGAFARRSKLLSAHPLLRERMVTYSVDGEKRARPI